MDALIGLEKTDQRYQKSTMETPTPERTFFGGITEQVWQIRSEWQMFEAIYGHTPDRVQLLNRRGTGLFFGRIQGALRDSVLLAIARLLDPARSAGKETLSLRGAIASAFPEGDGRRTEFDAELDALRDQCDAIREHRNKRISHNDRAFAMGEEVIPGVSRQMISQTISAIEHLTKRMRLSAEDVEVSFDEFEDETKAAEMLVNVLQRGHEVLDAEREERRDRMRRGLPRSGLDSGY